MWSSIVAANRPERKLHILPTCWPEISCLLRNVQDLYCLGSARGLCYSAIIDFFLTTASYSVPSVCVFDLYCLIISLCFKLRILKDRETFWLLAWSSNCYAGMPNLSLQFTVFPESGAKHQTMDEKGCLWAELLQSSLFLCPRLQCDGLTKLTANEDKRICWKLK